jgi:Ala-tRNA(Pro) deacylase
MTQIYIDPTIYTTKPAYSRLLKELAVYDLLEKLDIPYSRIDHVETVVLLSKKDW